MARFPEFACTPNTDGAFRKSTILLLSLCLFSTAKISFEPGLAARLAAHTLHSLHPHTASTLLLTQLSSLLDHEFQLLDAWIKGLLFG